MKYQLSLLGISLASAVTTLAVLRKSLVRPLHAAWWLVVACCMGLAGMFPCAAEAVGLALGIDSLPVVFLAIAVVLLLARMALADLEYCTMVLQQRRMNQRLAWLDLRVRQLERDGSVRSAAPFAPATPVVEESGLTNVMQKHD